MAAISKEICQITRCLCSPTLLMKRFCYSLSVSLRFAAGKAAFTEAPAAFMKAASDSYKQLGEEERRSLQAEAAASTKVQSLSRKGTRKEGGKIFRSMQPKVIHYRPGASYI